MHKQTSYYVTFLAPGSFMANDWSTPVDSADPRKVAWPDNAYAFRLFKREDVIDGDTTYQGKPQQIGKLFYHPDSSVQSLDEVRSNPRATPTLISNMECNRWKQIIWTRWSNWPQPFDPADTEVLRDGVRNG
jgi:hypothetical protein